MSERSKKDIENELLGKCVDFLIRTGRAPSLEDASAIGISVDDIVSVFGTWENFAEAGEDKYTTPAPAEDLTSAIVRAIVPESEGASASWVGEEQPDPLLAGAAGRVEGEEFSHDEVTQELLYKGSPTRTGKTLPGGAIVFEDKLPPGAEGERIKQSVVEHGGLVMPAKPAGESDDPEGREVTQVRKKDTIHGMPPIAHKDPDDSFDKASTAQMAPVFSGTLEDLAVLAASKGTASVPAAVEGVSELPLLLPQYAESVRGGTIEGVPPVAPEVAGKGSTMTGIPPMTPGASTVGDGDIVKKGSTITGIPPVTPRVIVPAPTVEGDDVYLTSERLKDIELRRNADRAAFDAAVTTELPPVRPESVVELTEIVPPSYGVSEAVVEAFAAMQKAVREDAERADELLDDQLARETTQVKKMVFPESDIEEIVGAVAPATSAVGHSEEGSIFSDKDDGYSGARQEPAVSKVVVPDQIGAGSPDAKQGAVAVPIAAVPTAVDEVQKVIGDAEAEAREKALAVEKTVEAPVKEAAAEVKAPPVHAPVNAGQPVEEKYVPDQDGGLRTEETMIVRTGIGGMYQSLSRMWRRRSEAKKERNVEEQKAMIEEHSREKPETNYQTSRSFRRLGIGLGIAAVAVAGAIGIGSYFSGRNAEQHAQNQAAVVDSSYARRDAGSKMFTMTSKAPARDTSVADDTVPPVAYTPPVQPDSRVAQPTTQPASQPAAQVAIGGDSGCSIRLGMVFDNTNYVDTSAMPALERYVIAQYAAGQREFFVYGHASIEDHRRVVHDDNAYNTRLATRRAARTKADISSIAARHGLTGVSVREASWSETETWGRGSSALGENRGVLVSTADMPDPESRPDLATALATYARNVPNGPDCDSGTTGSAAPQGGSSGSSVAPDTGSRSGSGVFAPSDRTDNASDSPSGDSASADDVDIFVDHLMNPGESLIPVYTEVSINDVVEGTAPVTKAVPLRTKGLPVDDNSIVRQVVQEYKLCVFGKAYDRSEFGSRFRERHGYDCDLATAREIALQDYEGGIDKDLVSSIRDMNDKVIELTEADLIPGDEQATRDVVPPQVPGDDVTELGLDDVELIDEAVFRYSKRQLEDMKDIVVAAYEGKAVRLDRVENLMGLYGLTGVTASEVQSIGLKVLNREIVPRDADLVSRVSTPATPSDDLDIEIDVGPSISEEQALFVYDLSEKGFDFMDIARIGRLRGYELKIEEYNDLYENGRALSGAGPIPFADPADVYALDDDGNRINDDGSIVLDESDVSPLSDVELAELDRKDRMERDISAFFDDLYREQAFEDMMKREDETRYAA